MSTNGNLTINNDRNSKVKAFPLVISFSVLILIRVGRPRSISIFSRFRIYLFGLFARIDNFMTIFNNKYFNGTAVKDDSFSNRVISVVNSTVGKDRTRSSIFICLRTGRETVRVFFCRLKEVGMVTSVLMFNVFFGNMFPFSYVRVLLLNLGRAIRVSRTLFLLFRFRFLRRTSTYATDFGHFKVRRLSTIGRGLHFVMITRFGHFTNDL